VTTWSTSECCSNHQYKGNRFKPLRYSPLAPLRRDSIPLAIKLWWPTWAFQGEGEISLPIISCKDTKCLTPLWNDIFSDRVLSCELIYYNETLSLGIKSAWYLFANCLRPVETLGFFVSLEHTLSIVSVPFSNFVCYVFSCQSKSNQNHNQIYQNLPFKASNTTSAPLVFQQLALGGIVDHFWSL